VTIAAASADVVLMLLLAGRPTPSVACIVQPGSNGGFQKVFFGDEEIAIPVYGRCENGLQQRLVLAGQTHAPCIPAAAQQQSCCSSA
jgi:hypothetical protein